MVSVVWMLSGSRISPTSTTSGSSRSAERSPRAKEWLSEPISRWLIADRFRSWTYSIGSSRVTMWHARWALIHVDHRCQSRRLPGSRGAGHEHESLRELGQPGEGRRQHEVVEGRDGGGDHAQGDRHTALGVEGVPPQAGPSLPREREVGLLVAAEGLEALRREQGLGDELGLVVGERLLAFIENLHVTVDPGQHGRSGGEEKVGPTHVPQLADLVHHEGPRRPLRRDVLAGTGHRPLRRRTGGGPAVRPGPSPSLTSCHRSTPTQSPPATGVIV